MVNVKQMRDEAFIAAQWHQERAIARQELEAARMFFWWMLERLGVR